MKERVWWDNRGDEWKRGIILIEVSAWIVDEHQINIVELQLLKTEVNSGKSAVLAYRVKQGYISARMRFWLRDIVRRRLSEEVDCLWHCSAQSHWAWESTCSVR